MPAVLLLFPVAYFLGTFPAAELVARATGHDVLREGSGNPGASNVYRLAGWKAGLAVLVADIGKGSVASAVGLALDGHRGAYLLGLAAVLGHVLPVTRRFKGGRGVATAGGALVVLFPLIALGLAVLWFLIARVLRKASVASIVVVAAFPFLVAMTGSGWFDIAVTAVLAAVVLARHVPNLRRLVRGQELDLGDDPGGTVQPQ
ncbi:MAG TPA: glycerol-3-phosphate acyltransferase [Acidimicrobiia bacterium]|nr:glycerol-3-phosphate acyltransferase [Acidimicrobiia bacterium]